MVHKDRFDEAIETGSSLMKSKVGRQFFLSRERLVRWILQLTIDEIHLICCILHCCMFYLILSDLTLASYTLYAVLSPADS